MQLLNKLKKKRPGGTGVSLAFFSIRGSNKFPVGWKVHAKLMMDGYVRNPTENQTVRHAKFPTTPMVFSAVRCSCRCLRCQDFLTLLSHKVLPLYKPRVIGWPRKLYTPNLCTIKCGTRRWKAEFNKHRSHDTRVMDTNKGHRRITFIYFCHKKLWVSAT